MRPSIIYQLPSSIMSYLRRSTFYYLYNLLPEYEHLLARRISDNSRIVEKFQLAHCPHSLVIRKEKCCTVSACSSCSIYLRIGFDLPSSITIDLRDINGVPKLGAQNPNQGTPWMVTLDSTGMISYQSLFVSEAVFCTVSEIVFDSSKIAIFGYPS